MFLHLFSLLPVSPLWELSPEVDSPAHGFSHWACDYFIYIFPDGFCHSEPLGGFYCFNFEYYVCFLVVFAPLSYQDDFIMTYEN